VVAAPAVVLAPPAHADVTEVTPNKYATKEACQADGPNVHLQHNDAAYPYWACRYSNPADGGDGYWHIWNATTQNG